MTPESPVASPNNVLSIPWPPSPEQELSVQEQHYHKSLSCPHFEQLPPAPVSPGSPLQPVLEHGPAFPLCLPDPRTPSAHTPFSDLDPGLEDSTAGSSSPPEFSAAPPKPAVLQYNRPRHGCHTSPGPQQFMLSPPRNQGQRPPPVSTGYGSYQQQYMHRLRSAPLSSPPRKTYPSSPQGDKSEPSWLHHLRTLRTPVPWEELGEAWAAASQAEVQQQVLADLPEDVQQDIRTREHQAKEQRERSLGARISRVLSRISLGGTSQQLSPVAGASSHNTEEQHTAASVTDTSVGDGSSSEATSRQPSTSLVLGFPMGTYDAGTLAMFGTPPGTAEDVAAAVLVAANTAKGRMKPPPHRQATSGSNNSATTLEPQAPSKAWDLVHWMLGKISPQNPDQQAGQQAVAVQCTQPPKEQQAWHVLERQVQQKQERASSQSPHAKAQAVPLSEQVLDQPYMIAASACL